MSNLIRGEFYKLKKSKYFIGMIIISIVISIPFIKIWSGDIQENTMLQHGIYSIEYTFIFILFSSFLFALLAEDFIAKDFKNKNINKSFTYGYGRKEVILSKLIVFIMFSLFLELIYTVILVIYASMKYGFWDTLDTNAIMYLFRMISIGIIYNVATISVIGVVAVITKSSFFTFSSPIILFLVYYLFSESSLVSKKLFVVISYIHPYLRGIRAMGRFAPMLDIIAGVASSILILTIAIAGSLLYGKYEDIK
ncbi:ABC transporter permease [Clostridium drakei]|uniref:ABC transporter permease n=1 Tax=Clostridium drakei TaxID=332101 RepID=A0A2U8DRU8_9CLOT|nr:ABC transporter permease [Clostridium drakei]AWI05487.1 ABC transporter permease [Clostridium drakei]